MKVIKRVEYLPIKPSMGRCAILISFLVLMYILESLSIKGFVGNFTFSYIIKPILWIILACVVWSLPNIRAKGRLRLRGFLYFWSLNFAIIYIIISILAGIVDTLGKSPYNHSLEGMLINIIFVGSALVGREFIRSYLVNSFTDKENYLVFIATALIMTFTGIAFKNYLDIKGYEDLIKLIAQYIAPEFSQNLFASYLVYLGGPLTSIIYLGTVQGFHWLSPILPDLKWITSALIGIMCPAFFLMTMQEIYYNTSKQRKIRDRDKESTLGWMITCVISIAMIWFSVGVFPIYPSVVATGSMEPDIKPGDVILVEKIADMEGINNLKPDNVIQFNMEGVLVSHRIIGINRDEKGGISFKTKGDNNTGPDTDLVKPEDIRGKIVYIVPKIGWPTLLIKSDKDIPLDKIVF